MNIAVLISIVLTMLYETILDMAHRLGRIKEKIAELWYWTLIPSIIGLILGLVYSVLRWCKLTKKE